MTEQTNAIEKVLQGAFTESGWAGLEEASDTMTQEAQHAAALNRFEAAMEIARPYMTPDGKLSLASLRRMTIEAPTWVPDATGAMEGAAAGFAREGQNSLIRHIDRCIAVAMAGPPSPLATGETTP